MDGIRATPYINPLLGSVNELVGGLLGYMRDPRRTQQLQGLAGLLESTGVPKTLERLAYGEPLTNIQRANVPVLRPETAEALLTLSPVPQATSRAAMAAGRAGERMAERVVPQIMERGGMPAGLLEGMSSRTVSPLTVYHGSPAKFEKFDASKIGTGEGAQSYGYGHYVAQSPAVAKDYQRRLAKEAQATDLNTKMQMVDVGGKPLTSFNVDMDAALIDAAKSGKKEFVNVAEAKKARWENLAQDQSYPFQDYAKQKAGAYTSLLDAAKKTDVDYTGTGMFYEIDLPDEQIARMLDWDKPLSEQPDIVKSINPQSLGLTYKKLENGNHAFVNSEGKIIGNLQRGGTQESFTKNWTEDVLRGTGSDLYRQLGQGMEGGPKVSSALRQAGIPGIRYLDQGSRGAGEGTSNFVVFPGNEGLLTIQKRNNEVIAPTSLLDYRIQHRPMTVEGGASKLHEAGSVFGEDVYGKNALQYFGSGLSGEKTSLDILKKVRGNPDAEITIYRGVPEGVNTINKGDWVTLDPKMAEEYGNVISKKVKAKDITTWPDSLVEFGYYPD